MNHGVEYCKTMGHIQLSLKMEDKKKLNITGYTFIILLFMFQSSLLYWYFYYYDEKISAIGQCAAVEKVLNTVNQKNDLQPLSDGSTLIKFQGYLRLHSRNQTKSSLIDFDMNSVSTKNNHSFTLNGNCGKLRFNNGYPTNCSIFSIDVMYSNVAKHSTRVCNVICPEIDYSNYKCESEKTYPCIDFDGKDLPVDLVIKNIRFRTNLSLKETNFDDTTAIEC